MKVIEGAFEGGRGRIVSDVFAGPVMQIAGKKLKLPQDFKTIKLISRDAQKPNFIIMLLLAVTIIGIPIAILYAVLKTTQTANIALELVSGERFIANCDNDDYKVISDFIGKGELEKVFG